MPVIGLSAHALAGERDKALAAGCEEFDTKPVEFDRLLGKIRKLVVNFREVVHSVRTGNADVAKP